MKTIYPTGTAFIPGVPAIEQEVSDKDARRLLKFSPPAFTLDKPDGDPPETRLSLNERPPVEAPGATEPENTDGTTPPAPSGDEGGDADEADEETGTDEQKES